MFVGCKLINGNLIIPLQYLLTIRIIMYKFLTATALTLVLLVFAPSSRAQAQEMGLSFSYFIPKDGYLSTPISPFSLRGVGVDITRFFALQTGFSLYRMTGMNVRDMEGVETDRPIVGPNFTIMVPAELVLQFIGQSQEFRLKAGGFGFYGFANKINYGNLDRAIREFESWDVANSEVDHSHGLGLGYFFGAEYVVFVTRQWGISLEGNYFIGDAPFEMTGSYTGGTESGPLVTRTIDWQDSKIDFTGLEISIGVIITP